MPAHKIEIVFITVVNWVAITTRRVLRRIRLRPDEVKSGITGPPARSCDICLLRYNIYIFRISGEQWEVKPYCVVLLYTTSRHNRLPESMTVR